MTDNKLFEEPTATELAQKRINARQKRRLTYDCMNAIVQRNSVICKKRHEFKSIGNRKDKGLGLLTILRGVLSSACQECPDYDGEEDE